MIAWKGNTGVAGLVPHLSFVKRKPEPLGVELKTVCDCSTGFSSLPLIVYIWVALPFAIFWSYLEGIVVAFLKADGLATFVAAMCLVEVWADAIGTTFVSTLSGQR
jgi:hypothetical protein